MGDTRPFTAYWPLALTQIVGGRTWSISFVRYQTPAPLLVDTSADDDPNGVATAEP